MLPPSGGKVQYDVKKVLGVAGRWRCANVPVSAVMQN